MFNISKTKTPAPKLETFVPPVPMGSSALSPTPTQTPPSPPVPETRSRANTMVQSLATTQKPSVVSEGFVMRGDIDSAGVLHVEGSVIGVVNADDINIGTAGLVDGTLTCKNLNIKGRVSGKVVCDELVIAPSAQVKGEISYLSLTIGSGASVECEMTCRQIQGR